MKTIGVLYVVRLRIGSQMFVHINMCVCIYRCSPTYDGLTYDFSTLQYCKSDMHNELREIFNTLL